MVQCVFQHRAITMYRLLNVLVVHITTVASEMALSPSKTGSFSTEIQSGYRMGSPSATGRVGRTGNRDSQLHLHLPVLPGKNMACWARLYHWKLSCPGSVWTTELSHYRTWSRIAEVFMGPGTSCNNSCT